MMMSRRSPRRPLLRSWKASTVLFPPNPSCCMTLILVVTRLLLLCSVVLGSSSWSIASPPGGAVAVVATVVVVSTSSSRSVSARPTTLPSTTTTTEECDNKIQDVTTWFDPHGKCGSEPSCACGYDARGRLYAECNDQQRQCSNVDRRVCGYQSAKGTYWDDGTAEYLYVWDYDSGKARSQTLRYYRWNDDTCTFTIADRRGAEVACVKCESTTCSDGRNSFYIDCSNYEVGAVAAGCSKALDRPGSVLHGFGITDGSCVPGGTTTAAAPHGFGFGGLFGDGVTGTREVVLAILLMVVARLVIPQVRKRMVRSSGSSSRRRPPPRALDQRRTNNSEVKAKNNGKVKRS